MRDDVRLSVVVPVLNEAENVPHLLTDIARVVPAPQVIVVDGGSRDSTVALAQEGGAQVLETTPGRAHQMNAGARSANGDWLLFLHADSRLDGDAANTLSDFLNGAPNTSVAAAHFAFALGDGSGLLKAVEVGQRLRSRLTGLVYGDQGLLVRRSVFDAVGGFPELDIMEDVAMVRRLRRHGTVVELKASLRTSARRYRRQGVLRTSLRNGAMVSAYLLGVSPERLARWYPPEPTQNTRRRLLLVFVKLPEPGRVKTRLAKTMGSERAAQIYATMARRVIKGVLGGDYDVVICHDPPDRRSDVAAWLDMPDLEFWPQVGGDLGTRLRHAVERGLQYSRELAVIGTDAPDVTRRVVEEAFNRLEPGTLVLGPAQDGGYYLIACNRPEPSLFSEIDWSTDRVARQTRSRATKAGLRVVELPVLRDVDEEADVPSDLLA